MKNFDTIHDLLNVLKYGQAEAQTADELFEKIVPVMSSSSFKRQLRMLAGEARKFGHRVIGDDKGYYIAINEKEWSVYCTRRFAAIKDELVSLAGAERIAVRDLIKTVYAVHIDDNNYNLNL